VFATLALWLLDQPRHAPYRWKIACVSGLASAGLGLLIAQAISHLWVRERPFLAHPSETLLLVAPSHEPSFPSDHAVAAFAIAVSVALIGGRRVGALFLAGAAFVGITRVFVGLHYPGDIAGGALVGLLAALLVFYAGRHRWSPIVGLISRLTDPLWAPVWRALDVQKRRRQFRTR
jgi:undecaprenyl-diphosphatase